MSVQVSYTKQFILGLILMAILLVIVEGIIITNEIFSFCDFIGMDAMDSIDFFKQWHMCIDNNSIKYDYLTPIRLVTPSQHMTHININHHGLRYPEITTEKPEEVFRIILVGGSTAFGSASTSDKTTIPGFMEKKFHENGWDFVQVINAGMPGAFSLYEGYFIQNILTSLEPDLIIMYDGWNDVNQRNGEFYNITIDMLEDHYNLQTPTGTGLRTFFFQIGYKTPIVLWDLIRSVGEKSESEVGLKPYGFYSDKIAQFLEKNWSDVCEFGQKENFSTLIVLQPFLGTSNRTLSPDEQSVEYSKYFKNTLSYWKDFSPNFSHLEKSCTKVIDLRNVFDNVNEPTYWDWVHLNDKGNEIVAQRLFELTSPIVKDELS